MANELTNHRQSLQALVDARTVQLADANQRLQFLVNALERAENGIEIHRSRWGLSVRESGVGADDRLQVVGAVGQNPPPHCIGSRRRKTSRASSRLPATIRHLTLAHQTVRLTSTPETPSAASVGSEA